MADKKTAASKPVKASTNSTGSTASLDSFAPAWDLLTKHIGLWGALWLLGFVPVLIIGVLVAMTFSVNSDVFVGKAVPTTTGIDISSLLGALLVWALLAGVYSIFVYAAQLHAMLEAANNKSVSFAQAINAGKASFGRLLVLTLVMMLILAAGFIAFIIPGIILGVLLLFAPLISIDKKTGALESIRASIDLVSANVGKVVVFILAAFLFAVVVTLLAGIILDIFPEDLATFLEAIFNGVVGVYFGLALTKFYLSIR